MSMGVYNTKKNRTILLLIAIVVYIVLKVFDIFSEPEPIAVEIEMSSYYVGDETIKLLITNKNSKDRFASDPGIDYYLYVEGDNGEVIYSNTFKISESSWGDSPSYIYEFQIDVSLLESEDVIVYIKATFTDDTEKTYSDNLTVLDFD